MRFIALYALLLAVASCVLAPINDETTSDPPSPPVDASPVIPDASSPTTDAVDVAPVQEPPLTSAVSTLIPQDISAPEWTVSSGTTLKCRPAAQSITMADGSVVRDTVHLNSNAFSGDTFRVHKFVAPYSGTVTFSIPMAKPSWVVGASTPVIYITNSSNTILGSTVATLSTTGQVVSASATVTGGQEYQARIAVYDTVYGLVSQSQALCGPATVRMAARGTGLWAKNYVRIEAKQGAVLDTVWTFLDPAGRHVYFSPYARLAVDTDAESVIVEYHSTYSDTDYGAGAVMVGNPGQRATEPWYQVQPLITGRVALSPEITLAPGRKRLEYWQAPQSGSLGMFVRAIYLPASATTTIAPQPGGRTLLVYGDSIASGSTSPGSWNAARGLPALLRRKFPGNIVFDAWGGRALLGDGYVSTGGVLSATSPHQALRSKLMDRVGQSGATDVLIAIGCNDWSNSGNGVSAANFQVSYQALAADLMSRYPHVRLFFMTPIYRASLSAETVANAGGATMPQLRTAISNAVTAAIAAEVATRPVAASVPPKAIVIDGLTIAGSTDIGTDGIHPIGGPSYWSAEKMAEAILTAMDNVF